MTLNGWLQILLFLAVVLAVTAPLGRFMTRVFTGERTWLDPICRPIERLIYRATGVDEAHEMRWTEYAVAMLLFSGVSMLLLYLMLRLQQWLPWNPQGFGAVAPDLAFNTAASFTTNTNWQSYSGESTMSYLTQMAGLAYHNFVSAATGIALALAFIRGIAQKEKDTVGNFWVDLVRCTLWLLLPFSLAGSLVLVSQGVVQNLRPYDKIAVLDPQAVGVPGGAVATGTPGTAGAGGTAQAQVVRGQVVAQGPVASQEIIKELGTNGGGFFNANSAHPFENPTPFTNFFEMVCIFAISAGLTCTLGEMTGSRRHGWAVWGAMAFLFLAGVTTAYSAEARGNPLLTAAGADQSVTVQSPGGNMEGKECRFGIAGSVLFATVTTDASCGAVNGWHDSFTPLGGLVPLVNIMLGEVIFGGVGAGLYGILVFVILSVFIAGLMVGRTPEYLGKKVQAYDVQMAMLVILVFPLTILVLTAISAVAPAFGTASILNPGPHGLSEILYAFTSATGNNGSAFGGLTTNTHWYNISIGMAMLIGRFLMIIPMLAIAGSLGRKKRVPPSAGTFPVTTPLFSALLVGVIVIVGALTFFPALSLGPIVEHLLMAKGQVF
jgi:potassium-transporting ATPase potassium-binding subunit